MTLLFMTKLKKTYSFRYLISLRKRMMIDFTYERLAEPKLQFGEYFEHQDTKTGLAECGPFGLNVDGLHPSEIKVGFIGTRETITGAKEWIEMCSKPIESENAHILGGTSYSDNGLFG